MFLDNRSGLRYGFFLAACEERFILRKVFGNRGM